MYRLGDMDTTVMEKEEETLEAVVGERLLLEYRSTSLKEQ